MLNDTIAAIASGENMSAIAIVRVSGEEAISIVDRVFSKDLLRVESHTVHYGHIVDNASNKTLDEVLVSVFRAPKSFTTENVVEINCHGGEFVTRKILSLVLTNGARLAKPGEFTRRAFLNGRIDLTQAEAIQDLLEARHDDHLQMAIQSLKGSVSKLLMPLVEQLTQIISNIEVNIDYPEYDDVPVLTEEILLPQCNQWLVDIDALLEKANSGKLIKQGIPTAIVGKPNVGKSSLLNALLEEDKAIVTEIAGTTRDVVEGDIRLKNITLHLMDTAGIRETADEIERIGITKSKEVVDKAGLVIVVLDNSSELTDEDMELLSLTEGKERIIVYNKSDLDTKYQGLTISAKEANVQALIDEINYRYENHHQLIQEGTFSNERQLGLLNQAKQAMLEAKNALEQHIELDLVAIDLQNVYHALQEITGNYSKENLLDEIFSRFCLGK